MAPVAETTIRPPLLGSAERSERLTSSPATRLLAPDPLATFKSV